MRPEVIFRWIVGTFIVVLLMVATVRTVGIAKRDAASKVIIETASGRSTCAKQCWCDVRP
jgi:hypothetical protein